jgi:hypothetical protein
VDDGEDVPLRLPKAKLAVDGNWGWIDPANRLLGDRSLTPHLTGLV